MKSHYDMTAGEFIEYMHIKSEDVYYNLPNMPDYIETHVIYPSNRAAARVLFYEKGNKKNRISTYLDTINALGCMGRPYFELYPNDDNDCTRYYVDKQEQMYKDVIRLIDSRRKNNANET